MADPGPAPDDSALREYLLGNLSPERAAPVSAWLASDPSAAEFMGRIKADDTLTQALADTPAGEPVTAATVESYIRCVLDELACVVTPAATATSTQNTLPDGPAPMPWPGTLGSYRVLREIGRGGMGVVLEAEDALLSRRVAIKVITAERALDPVARARFLREAKAAAAIDHENVVPIHHVGEEGGVPYIVMPLLQGQTLETRLKCEAPLPPAEVIRLGREVAA